MSVNVKKNGLVVKLSGLYAQMVARLSDLSDAQISSPSDGQGLVYDSTTAKWKNKDLEYYLDETETLSTTDPTVYTFTDAKITTSSVIDVYAEIFGIYPSSVIVTTGECVVTFPKQTSAQSMTCRIYIR